MSSRRPRWRSAGLIPLALAGCSIADTARIVPVSDPVEICEAWRQINIRRSDVLSTDTAKSVVENNVGREALGCPYEEPPKASKQRVATRTTP